MILPAVFRPVNSVAPFAVVGRLDTPRGRK